MGFSNPGGARRCIGNVFAAMGFKCLPAVTISGFEFEQYGKREAGVRVVLTEEPQGGIFVSAREVV